MGKGNIMLKELTQKQMNFCLEYMKTGNASEAYRRAYNAENMQTNTIKVKASNMLSKGNIKVTIGLLRKKVEDKGILSFKEIQIMLSKRAKEELNSDGLKSIDILNKMSGNYEKDNKLDITTTIIDPFSED